MFFYPTRGSEKHFSPPETAHSFIFIIIFFFFIFIIIIIIIFIFIIEDVQGISSC